jgi:cytochrome c6
MGNFRIQWRECFKLLAVKELACVLAVSVTLSVATDVTCQAKASTSTGDDPGAKLFATKCEVCHGSDGRAGTTSGHALHAADLTSQAVQSQSDSALIGVISEGKGLMPSFKTALSQQQLSDLVRHIRALAANKAKQE